MPLSRPGFIKALVVSVVEHLNGLTFDWEALSEPGDKVVL